MRACECVREQANRPNQCGPSAGDFALLSLPHLLALLLSLHGRTDSVWSRLGRPLSPSLPLSLPLSRFPSPSLSRTRLADRVGAGRVKVAKPLDGETKEALAVPVAPVLTPPTLAAEACVCMYNYFILYYSIHVREREESANARTRTRSYARTYYRIHSHSR